MGQPQVVLPLAEQAYAIATGHGLGHIADQIGPLLQQILDEAQAAQARDTQQPVDIPMPHPGDDAKRASQLNIHYQQELAAWKALPWWQRLRVKKPEPPVGI